MDIKKKPVGGPVKLPLLIFCGANVIAMSFLLFRSSTVRSWEQWLGALVSVLVIAAFVLLMVGYVLHVFMQSERSLLPGDLLRSGSGYGLVMTRTASLQQLAKAKTMIGGVAMQGKVALCVTVMSGPQGIVLMTGPARRRFVVAKVPWSALVGIEAGYIENTVNVLRGIRITAMSDAGPVRLDFQSFGAGPAKVFPLSMEQLEDVVRQLLAQQEVLGIGSSGAIR